MATLDLNSFLAKWQRPRKGKIVIQSDVELSQLYRFKGLEIIQWSIDLDLPFLNTEQTKELFQKDKETDYNVWPLNTHILLLQHLCYTGLVLLPKKI